MSADATLKQAWGLIGLEGPADAATAAAAFRAAAKASHPDRPDGDPVRFRRVMAAWRLIQAVEASRLALPAPRRRPAPPPAVRLSPLQALHGGTVATGLGRRRLRVHIPPGLRNGDHLRLRGAGAQGEDVFLPVLIRPGDGFSVLGADLFMSAPVPARTLADGGRAEIDTPAGVRSVWITPGLAAPVRLRLFGLGLPARGGRPAGHLFVTLEPVEDAPSAAGDLLARFSRVWTPERFAA